MNDIELSIVIVSWNGMRHLPDCLAALRPQLPPDAELVLVDNGSRDGTAEWLRRAGVEHIALSRNVGFAAAINLGASRTRAPFILVLNADVIVEPGCVERLAAALREGDSRAGVPGGICLLIVRARVNHDRRSVRVE